MDNKSSYETMIMFDNGNKRRAYAIQYIVDIRQDANVVKLTLSAPFNTEMPDIGFDTEIQATNFFYDCVAKIEAYYKAMMPQKPDNLQDNTDKIKITQEHDKMANFITTLFDQISRDWQYELNNLEEKMDCLKLWVTARAKECK